MFTAALRFIAEVIDDGVVLLWLQVITAIVSKPQ